MKIKVGKAYEGGSEFRLEDGDYEVQITEIESTKGRTTMIFKTSNNVSIKKVFFLLEKDNKTVNERTMAALADYVTTAMQIEDMEVEVDTKDALGYYLKVYIKNGSYTSKEDGQEKKIYNVYSPRRCDGFSDGTASFVPANKIKSLADAASPVSEEEEEDELPFEPVETPSAEVDGEPDDIFKKFGL